MKHLTADTLDACAQFDNGTRQGITLPEVQAIIRTLGRGHELYGTDTGWVLTWLDGDEPTTTARLHQRVSTDWSADLTGGTSIDTIRRHLAKLRDLELITSHHNEGHTLTPAGVLALAAMSITETNQ